MISKSKTIWTIRELTQILRERQLNKFDCSFGVSGKRGNGKSTLIFKIFNSYKKTGFNPEKHQVYKQDDVMKLLANQSFSFCWDDEAINSGYKRDFQRTGQKDLIKLITNYRDNFNMYASALPFFYSLDKALRSLMFLHIHIIERGVAVILIPLESQIHGEDPWDTKSNTKIEEREYKRLEKNPDSSFRYHKFTTFAGYLYFGDLTVKQRKRYLEIKKRKREDTFQMNDKGVVELPFIDRIYNLLLEKKLTREGLNQICLGAGRKSSSTNDILNRMLKDNGENGTIKDFLRQDKHKVIHNNPKAQINDLIPTFTP